MKPITRIILILIIAAITGCYYDSEEQLYPKLYNPCDDADVTYSKTVATILHSCQSCHSNSNVAASEGTDVVLGNINQVTSVAKSGRLMGAINHDSKHVAMPPAGKLPDCEIKQLQKWIDANYPNN